MWVFLLFCCTSDIQASDWLMPYRCRSSACGSIISCEQLDISPVLLRPSVLPTVRLTDTINNCDTRHKKTLYGIDLVNYLYFYRLPMDQFNNLLWADGISHMLLLPFVLLIVILSDIIKNWLMKKNIEQIQQIAFLYWPGYGSITSGV